VPSADGSVKDSGRRRSLLHGIAARPVVQPPSAHAATRSGPRRQVPWGAVAS